MVAIMEEATINTVQARVLEKERNEYRKLLQEALYVLNQLPNTKIGDLRTYDLASKIENSFRRFI
jgi:hypothetical protein